MCLERQLDLDQESCWFDLMYGLHQYNPPLWHDMEFINEASMHRLAAGDSANFNWTGRTASYECMLTENKTVRIRVKESQN